MSEHNIYLATIISLQATVSDGYGRMNADCNTLSV